MTSRLELWLVAVAQAIATALMLLATGTLKIAVWQALQLGETRAPWQVPFALAIVLVSLPIALASFSTLRRLDTARIAPWLAIVFLLAVGASSAQALGALHLYIEKVP